MQAAATAVGFSALLPVKGRPAPRSVATARVPAAAGRRIIPGRVRAAGVTAEPAEVDYSSSISYVPQLLTTLSYYYICVRE